MTISADHILRELDQIHNTVKDTNAKLDSVIGNYRGFEGRLSVVEQMQLTPPNGEHGPTIKDHATWIGELKVIVGQHKTLFRLIGAALLLISGALAQHLAFH